MWEWIASRCTLDINQVRKQSGERIIETIVDTPTRTMHSLKDAFTSMIEKELSGFKSHDWHKILQVDFFTKKSSIKIFYMLFWVLTKLLLCNSFFH